MASIYTMGAYASDAGVTIYKDGVSIGTICTENDSEHGIFSVSWNNEGMLGFRNSYTETIEYDPLTGAIL